MADGYKTPNIDPTLARAYHEKCKDAGASMLQEGATYLALWVNRPARALGPSQGNQLVGFDNLKDLGFNVMADELRGALTQICVPLKPTCSPIGGTWETKQACEGLSQAGDGFFDANKIQQRARRAMIHAGLTGEGYILLDVNPVTKDFYLESLDPLETFFNAERDMVVTKRAISRRKALAMFSTKGDDVKTAIRQAPRYEPDRIIEVDAAGQWDAEDRIGLISFWCEKMGDGSEPETRGYFVHQLIGSGQDTVLDHGEWKWRLPVADAAWSLGHRGENDARPLGRTIAPIHYWMNECVRKVDDALAGAVPWLIGPKSSKPISDVPFQFVDNTDGEVKVLTPKVLNDDVTAWMGVLREQGGRSTGITDEAQTGAPPPAYKSGVALSTWKSIINANMGEQHEVYEGLHNKLFYIWVERAKDVYGDSKKARTLARGTKVLNQIDFAKINLPEDQWSVAFDVVSDLPKHIPMKAELLGWLHETAPDEFDVGMLFQHLDIVDFKAATAELNGPRDLILKQISKALNEGVYLPPNETQDHALLMKLSARALAAAEADLRPPPQAHLDKCLWLYLAAKAWTEQSPTAPTVQAPAAGPQMGAGITNPTGAATPMNGEAGVAAPLPVPVGPVA